MNKIFAVLSAAVFIAFAGQAVAADPVYFKTPFNFGGTGCPQGTVTVTGVNSDTLKVSFDQYDAAKPPRNNPISDAASKMSRTSCNFAVPVHVPQGYQVSFKAINWQGYAEGSTELRRKYFFAGRPFVKPKVDHPVGDFIIKDDVTEGNKMWSPCGEDVNLRMNSSIKAKSNKSYIAVDTVDLKRNGIVFGLQWRKCQ